MHRFSIFNFQFSTFNALLSGLLLPLALSGPGVAWIAALALAPLLVALLRSPLPIGQALLYGWLCGVLSTGLHFSYVTQALHPVVFAGAVAYIGFYTGVFAAGVTLCRRRSLEAACLVAPFLWTALEYIRSHILTGMPAGTLGVSQARMPPVIQIADITGVLGISFLLVVINVAACRLLLLHWIAARRPAGVWCGAAAGLLAVALGYGAWMLRTPETGEAHVRIAAVQGDIDERGLDQAEIRRHIFDRYRARTTPLKEIRPDLIVYPETMTGSYLAQDSVFLDFLEDMGQTTGGAFLVGSRHLVEDSVRYRLYNSVFLVNETGQIHDRYDKNRPAPFGEYTPLGHRFPWLTRFRLASSELSPGADFRPVQRRGGPPIGVGICYEAMFGDAMRRTVANGARLLAIVSDDFWFHGSDESRQIFEESIFRAVENRIPVVRCANMGVSGVIDTRGRVIGARLEEPGGVVYGTVHLRTETTLYTRFGDAFAWACCLAAPAMIGWFSRRDYS